jgi:UDP-glucose 4-epimerase
MARNGLNILVTGGSGYIGSHIIKKLLSNGDFFVVSIDNKKSSSQDYNKKCTFINGSVGDKKNITKILEQYKIDLVVHLAALISVEESMKNPDLYFKNNVFDAINLLEAMEESGVKRIIFSSSAATYGSLENKFLEEKNETNPTNIYGLTKLFFEDILKHYNKEHGFNCISFRLFNIAGADPSGKLKECHNPETHIIPKTIQSIYSGKPVMIYADNYPTPDGTCIRDYIHVDDVATAFLSAIPKTENKICEVFNIGSGKGYSVKEVVDKCYQLMHKEPKIIFEDRRQGDCASLIANNKKIKTFLDWELKYSLDDMILHTIKSEVFKL